MSHISYAFAWVLTLAAAGVAFSKPAPALMQTSRPHLNVLVHLANIGDKVFREGQVAGTTGESRQMEGLEVTFRIPVDGLGIRGFGHLAGIGDTPWTTGYIGTRGQSRRLEGVALELTGTLAKNYSIVYQVHIASVGWTPAVADGKFAGTRGRSLAIEAIVVSVVPKALVTEYSAFASAALFMPDFSDLQRFSDDLGRVLEHGARKAGEMWREVKEKRLQEQAKEQARKVRKAHEARERFRDIDRQNAAGERHERMERQGRKIG